MEGSLTEGSSFFPIVNYLSSYQYGGSNMKKVAKLKYSIKDLDTQEYRNNEKISFDDVKICIVDDEDFQTAKLNNAGFKNIFVRKEFGTIEDYEKYDIILFDVTGVGNLYYSNEGVGAAEDVQKRWPEKIVAIYTARDPDEIKKKFEYFDDIDIIQKEQGDVLKKTLIKYAEELVIPYFACVRLEKILNRQTNLTYLEKATAEHGFVASVIEGNREYIKSVNFKALMDGLSLIETSIKIVAAILQLVHIA